LLTSTRVATASCLLRPSWSWSYGSWIYNYLCNQCLSPITLWVRIPLRWGVLDTTVCHKVCQWFATNWSFSPVTPVSSTMKTDRHDISAILLEVVLNTITKTKPSCLLRMLLCNMWHWCMSRASNVFYMWFVLHTNRTSLSDELCPATNSIAHILIPLRSMDYMAKTQNQKKTWIKIIL
jgi:hypothetical protein